MDTPENENLEKKKIDVRLESTDKPLGHWSQRELSDRIPCPFLLTAYNNHWLNPSQDGTVTENAIEELLINVGADSAITKLLGDAADASDGKKDGAFNLFTLRESNLNHSGSTGIRDPKSAGAMDRHTQETLLQSKLLDFSVGGRMYSDQFAAAANQGQKSDPGLKGTFIQTVEFTALLDLFGRLDEDGRKYLTTDDVRGLWLDGRFPEGWVPKSASELSSLQVAMNTIRMLLKRLWN